MPPVPAGTATERFNADPANFAAAERLDDTTSVFVWFGGEWDGELEEEVKRLARARFDAAHEFAHLCLHRWIGAEEIEDKERLKEIEREADRFAGAFLLPSRSFPNEVFSPRAESFIDLKARWKVSIQAMVYRAKDLGLFDERQVTNIHKQISYKKWRTNEPLDTGPRAITFEEPLLLKRVADLVFASGRYSADSFRSDLALADADLEDLTGYEFLRLEDQAPDIYPTLK